MKKVYIIRYSNGEEYEDYEDSALVAYTSREKAELDLNYIKNNLYKFYTTDERVPETDRETYKEWFDPSCFTDDTFSVFIEEIELVD